MSAAEQLVEALIDGRRAWLNVVDGRVEWVTVEWGASDSPRAALVDAAIVAHGYTSGIDATRALRSDGETVCFAAPGWQPLPSEAGRAP